MSEETIINSVVVICVTIALCFGIACGTKCGLNTSTRKYQAVQSIVNSGVDDEHKLLQIKAMLWGQ